MKRVSLYNLNFYLCVGRIMLVFSSTVGAHTGIQKQYGKMPCVVTRSHHLVFCLSASPEMKSSVHPFLTP